MSFSSSSFLLSSSFGYDQLLVTLLLSASSSFCWDELPADCNDLSFSVFWLQNDSRHCSSSSSLKSLFSPFEVNGWVNPLQLLHQICWLDCVAWLNCVVTLVYWELSISASSKFHAVIFELSSFLSSFCTFLVINVCFLGRLPHRYFFQQTHFYII